MQGYVPGEQPQDAGIVKLNTNENPYPPAPGVARALRDFSAASLRLYPDPLCRALCAKIAELHGVRSEQVLVANGSDEVLALCARAFAERDGTIGFFEPSYSLYPVLAQIEDVRTRPVPLTPEFEWALPADYAASLFFLTNPNAPTGMLYLEATVRDFCASFDGVVLMDEAYVDFARRDLMDLARTSDRVIVARTLSKSFSLAGLRLGYAVGPAPLIDALHKIKDSYNVDRLAQELGLAALSELPHMRANAARVIATRERTAAALAELGFWVFPSEANFLWVRPPGAPAETVFRALRERKIFVRYFPGPSTGACLRISIGTDGDMERLLAALRRIPGAH